MKNFDVKSAIAQLELIFDKANEKYFNGKLIRPIITIQYGKGDAYGWCTTYEAWQSNDEKYFEINICAEYLSRSLEELCGTILHQMVHLHNITNGIKDCKGKYHNVKFRNAAEKIGMVVEKTTYGYCKTFLNDDQIKFFNSLELKDFGFKRIQPEKKTSKKSGYKYVCPVCGASFWSGKVLNVWCGDCEEHFEITNK